MDLFKRKDLIVRRRSEKSGCLNKTKEVKSMEVVISSPLSSSCFYVHFCSIPF